MATRNQIRHFSYKRNRNYSIHFNWTYELNCDLYKCYIKAKEDPSVGYMRRLKTNWLEMHPEYEQFSEKHLAQQVRFIMKKNKTLDRNLSMEENVVNPYPNPPDLEINFEN